MTWQNPWMLCLLVLLVPIWWRWFDRARHPAVRFSSVVWLRQQRASPRLKCLPTIPILRTLAVGLLVACLARPQLMIKETSIDLPGIGIQMLVDRSSSMRAMDFRLDGRRADRLSAAKRVFKEFVLGGEGLQGRTSDLIGMIAFAGYADTQCPLTLDYAFVLEMLERTELVSPDESWEEDGTAIGDAVALAVARFGTFNRGRSTFAANELQSKIIILLTDGENNTGEISPEAAARLAALQGIKIYTIGTGTTGIVPLPVRTPSGETLLQPTQVTLDEETLRSIAKITGGRYWRATDTNTLREIYAEIDRLEKTEIKDKRYFEYAELATEPVPWHGRTWPPVLVIAAGLLALEILLTNTVFRKVP